MRTEKEINGQIKKTTEGYKHVLICGPASTVINSVRALMQLSATTQLDALYWALGKKRPRFKCDDYSKMDH